MKKAIKAIAAALALCLILTSCGSLIVDSGGKKEDSGDQYTVEGETYEFPKSVELTDEEIEEAIIAYRDYANEVLADTDFEIAIMQDDDGRIFFDGIYPDSTGKTQKIQGLRVFESERDCFAYLYENYQVDGRGGILPEVNDELKAQVAKVIADKRAELLAAQQQENNAEETKNGGEE